MAALDQAVALVTGGASGLGEAIVGRFVTEGARVAVLDRSAAGLERLREAHGRSVIAVQGEVTSLEDNQRTVAEAVGAFGRLDVFVGNAGVYDNRISLRQMPDEKLSQAFDELFGIDVKGYLLGAKACLEELQKTHGRIIFTASISSFYPGFGGILYIAAKHAVAGLTKQLAFELAPDIRVNAVAPGYIATNLGGLDSLEQGTSKSTTRPRAESFPLRFVPQPEDYVDLYVFLASATQSRILSGQVILADEGTSWHDRQRR